MSPLIKQIINTCILCLIIAIVGIMISMKYPSLIDRQSLAVMLLSMLFIVISVLSLIFIGKSKPTDMQAVFTFAAISVKFVLSAILAIIYFKVYKKIGLYNILIFFVLYLTFAIYTAIVVVKTLNIRPLNHNIN